MESKFGSALDASRALLIDTTKILIDHSVKFVVVGGWAPVLFHARRFGHPGTYDVDILLAPESLDDGTFESASEAMLRNDYLRAPKNTFQAHKILSVSGEEFVYHVDFLNERHRGEEVDIVWGKGRMHSIYTDSMQAVFRYGEYRSVDFLPGVCFPSPETFIATKAAAANVKKRKRDAFDVFVTAADQPEDFKQRWRQLVESDGLFLDADEQLSKALKHGEAMEKIIKILREQKERGEFQDTVPTEEEVYGIFGFLVAA